MNSLNQEAHSVGSGEVLNVKFDDLRQSYSVSGAPATLLGAANSEVIALKLRHRTTAAPDIEPVFANDDFHAILLKNPSGPLLEILETLVELSFQGIWQIERLGKVVGGPWANWLVGVGEPWSDRLSPSRRLADQDVRQLYSTLTDALFGLHEKDVAHGNIASNTIVRCGSQPVWKLLPPLHISSADPMDDMLQLGKLFKNLIGSRVAPTPNSQAMVSHAPFRQIARWPEVLAGLLDPSTVSRWSSARALIGAAPLPIPSHLTVEARGEARVITWQLPTTAPQSSDSSDLYEISNDVYNKCGTVCSLQKCQDIGKRNPSQDNSVVIYGSVHGRRFQVVSTFDRRLHVFGPIVELSDVPEVRKFEANVHANYLRTRWQWPEGATAVYVCTRPDRFPFEISDAEHHWSCGFDEYQSCRSPTWPLEGRQSERLFITAFAVIDTPMGMRCSSGASPGCRWTGFGREHRVKYRLSQPISKSGSVRIRIESTANCEIELPEMTLGISIRHAPHNLNEARFRRVVPRLQVLSPGETREVSIDCRELPRNQTLTARLFAATGRFESWLDLVCEPAEGLSLS